MRIVPMLLFLGGCATSLNAAHPTEFHFEIGDTPKEDVADALGLPAVRRVVDGYEHWGYDDGPQSSQGFVFINGFTGKIKAKFSPLTTKYVYVFDERGILIDTRGHP